MGTWSYCIHVVPANTAIDLSKIDLIILKDLSHSGFFASYLEKKNTTSIYTLEEIKDQCCKTAKIYGYLNKTELTAWKNLLLSIAEQLPNENRIEFHFYCSDYGIPYYFQFVRKGRSAETFLHVGSPEHVVYTKLKGVLDEDGEIITDDLEKYDPEMCGIDIEFDNDQYVKYYKFLIFKEVSKL